MSAAVVAGCSDSGPDKTLATVRSWTATLTLAANDRARHAISSRYALQLRDRAAESLTDASSELSRSAPHGEAHAEAVAATDSLRMAIRQLEMVASQ